MCRVTVLSISPPLFAHLKAAIFSEKSSHHRQQPQMHLTFEHKQNAAIAKVI